MTRNQKAIITIGLMIAATWTVPARAAVTTAVTLNSATGFAGITSWPSPPTVDTTAAAANPGAFMEVVEGNFGDAIVGFSFAQSFTATTSGKLTHIQLPVTGDPASVGGVNFRVHVFDTLGKDFTDITFYDPNMDMVLDPYMPDGTDISMDLLTDTSVQTWAGYTEMGAMAAVLGITLTDADQVDVTAGNTYVVEFEFPLDYPGQMFIARNGANAATTNYVDGQAFRSRVPLNGAIRDIAMSFTIESGTTPLAGDFNENGTVDGADFDLWETGFGVPSGAAHGQGDADADGDVDGADFLVWQQQVGTLPAVGAVAAIPEPASWMLAIGALLAARAAQCGQKLG